MVLRQTQNAKELNGQQQTVSLGQPLTHPAEIDPPLDQSIIHC